MKKIVAIGFIAAISQPAFAIYKCDVNGVAKYQNSPCDGDGVRIEYNLPSKEQQERAYEEQRRINRRMAEQDQQEKDRQKEAERQGFWNKLEADRIASQQRLQQRLNEIDQNYQQRRLEIRCSDRYDQTDTCDNWRYEKRWERKPL